MNGLQKIQSHHYPTISDQDNDEEDFTEQINSSVLNFSNHNASSTQHQSQHGKSQTL